MESTTQQLDNAIFNQEQKPKKKTETPRSSYYKWRINTQTTRTTTTIKTKSVHYPNIL